jgi:hypothetical protein
MGLGNKESYEFCKGFLRDMGKDKTRDSGHPGKRYLPARRTKASGGGREV